MNLLAAIIDATIDQEAGRPPAEASDRGQPIRLDLHPALAVLGYYDGVYLVISEMPAGTRLSAGRSNTNGTWSLLPDELENLTIMPPEGGKDEFLLTVSIATPDPDGYDFASMTAQFHVHVAGGTSTVPFNSLKRIEPQPQQQEWPDLVQRAVQLSRTRLQTILGDEASRATSEPAAASAHPRRVGRAAAGRGCRRLAGPPARRRAGGVAGRRGGAVRAHARAVVGRCRGAVGGSRRRTGRSSCPRAAGGRGPLAGARAGAQRRHRSPLERAAGGKRNPVAVRRVRSALPRRWRIGARN